MDTLEKTVSDAILQKDADTIDIGGVTYAITPATVGTVIMVSELISGLPEINKEAGDVLQEVLGTARGFSVLGKIAAVLILGAKRVKEKRMITTEQPVERQRFSWRKFRRETITTGHRREVPEVDYIAERILDEVSSDTLIRVVTRRLSLMQLGSFFELTTFLSGANLLRRTREVETASGE